MNDIFDDIFHKVIIIHDPQFIVINGETFLQDFLANSETNVSELLENLEHMIPRFYKYDMFSIFKCSTRH